MKILKIVSTIIFELQKENLKKKIDFFFNFFFYKKFEFKTYNLKL